jgi:formylglycine-generating enzyme required for sulfatase activity
VALLAVCPLAGATVVMPWAAVGDPGNAGDGSPLGSVPYIYQMGKFDVNCDQYAQFLNTNDPTGANTLGLYSSRMSSDLNVAGIAFDASGVPGSRYSVISGQANKPVAYVSFYSAVRFANWLNNGQGNATTESGSYTLLGGTPEPSNGNTLTRNPGNGVFIPNISEWHKAAYYKGGGTNSGYWKYATQSDTQPTSAPPSPTATNSANYLSDTGTYAVTGSSTYDPNQNYLTDVGAYGNSPSAYGTFDQNGNLFQWLETPSTPLPTSIRDDRGGAWGDIGYWMEPYSVNSDSASIGEDFLGFRVLEIPEPASGLWLLLGGTLLVLRRKK